MSKEGNFLVYCIEKYKSAKHLTGKQVSELFSKYNVWGIISIPALRCCIRLGIITS